MSRTIVFVVFVALATLPTGCKKNEATVSGEATGPIEGTYIIERMENGGETVVSDKPPSERTLRITPDRLIFISREREDAAMYKIDVSQTPPTIDTLATTSDGKEERRYGIYKMEGDTLSLWFADSDKPDDRPKDFKVEKGAKMTIMVLQKKK